MNTRKGKDRFKKFLILLDSGLISTIVTVRIIKKLHPKEDSVMQWHTQAGKISTNIKVKIDFNVPELSATKIVTWNCHVDDYTKGRYDMILCRYLLTVLGLNINLYDHVIEADDGTLKWSTAPMVDLGMYEFKC